MTTKIINPTEFTSWSKEIWENAEIVLKHDERDLEERAKISKIISAFCVRISSKNTFALEVFSNTLGKKFEKLPEEIREQKFNFPFEDGVRRRTTFKEWKQYFHQRVEDHHKARIGKDIGEADLPLIMQRLKNIKALEKGKEREKEKLLSQIYNTNKEDYDLVHGVLDLRKEFFDITEEDIFEELGENPEEVIQKSPYLFEDFSQILIKAQEAIENENHEPEKPEKKKEEKKRQIKTLEEEIKELERQNKELERKLSQRSLDPTKKQSYEEDAKEIQRQLQERRARLDRLQKDLENTGDGKKMDLALGLGIFAAVVAVICLIILLVRPSRRNQY